jgi:hypothetical protein
MMGERGDEHVAVVVVAGNQVHRHRERRQQGAQTLVLRGAAGVDQVAGRQHNVGPRPQTKQMLDGAGEVGRCVHTAVGQHAFGPDVRVRDLRDDHG